MPEVLLKSLTKTYAGGIHAVRGVDLEVHDGEFMVLVGPSGCDKTTTLRTVAGLEEISSGQLPIGGRDVTDTPPAKRGVAMVFQSYTRYPHMTIAENMGFALKMAGTSKAEIRESVGTAAEILQLGDLLSRKPKELGATILYVTHDQVEAMTLGNRVALFHAGRIEQVGQALELYGRPANRFVAGFLGSLPISLLPVRASRQTGGGVDIDIPGLSHFPIEAPNLSGDPSAAAWVDIRPEHLTLSDPEDAGALPVQAEMVERLGDSTIICLRHQSLPTTMALKQPGSLATPPQQGDLIHVRPDPQQVLPFDFAGHPCR